MYPVTACDSIFKRLCKRIAISSSKKTLYGFLWTFNVMPSVWLMVEVIPKVRFIPVIFLFNLDNWIKSTSLSLYSTTKWPVISLSQSRFSVEPLDHTWLKILTILVCSGVQIPLRKMPPSFARYLFSHHCNRVKWLLSGAPICVSDLSDSFSHFNLVVSLTWLISIWHISVLEKGSVNVLQASWRWSIWLVDSCFGRLHCHWSF